MLFLLNDRLLNFRPTDYRQPLDISRFHALSLPYVLKLGQELFAENPLLHHEDLEKAQRLALLIVSKAPDVNAALFVAPAKGCRPDEVTSRLASLSIDVVAALSLRDRHGELNPVTADREVWRRLAA